MARILVIDDDADMRAFLEQTLQGAGHEVVLAAEGGDGLKQERARPVDLVITDLYTPGKDGIEVIGELRKRRPGIPIVAMSGRAAAGGLLAVAKAMGAGEVLQKPFRTEELLAAVGRALRGE